MFSPVYCLTAAADEDMGVMALARCRDPPKNYIPTSLRSPFFWQLDDDSFFPLGRYLLLLPDLAEEAVKHVNSCLCVCFDGFCWYLIWSCSLPTPQSS